MQILHSSKLNACSEIIFLNPVLEDEAENVKKDLTQQFFAVSMKYQISCDKT
jgi:hypothetical protein